MYDAKELVNNSEDGEPCTTVVYESLQMTTPRFMKEGKT